MRLLPLLLLLAACGKKEAPAPAAEAAPPVSRPAEAAQADLRIEGHGRAVGALAGTVVARLGEAAGPKARPDDLLTSAFRTGSLKNAIVPSAGPPLALIDGDAADGGVAWVKQGSTAGAWTLHTPSGLVVPWPETVLVRVEGAHPARQPFFLAKSADTDEVVYVSGVLDAPLGLGDVFTPDMQVIEDHWADAGWAESRYTADGATWHQRIWMQPVGARHVAVVAQFKEGGLEALRDVGQAVADGITVQGPKRGAVPGR